MAIRIDQNHSQRWRHNAGQDGQKKNGDENSSEQPQSKEQKSSSTNSHHALVRSRSKRCQRADNMRMMSDQFEYGHEDNKIAQELMDELNQDIKETIASCSGNHSTRAEQLNSVNEEGNLELNDPIFANQVVQVSVQRVIASAPSLLESHGKVSIGLTHLLHEPR